MESGRRKLEPLVDLAASGRTCGWVDRGAKHRGRSCIASRRPLRSKKAWFCTGRPDERHRTLTRHVMLGLNALGDEVFEWLLVGLVITKPTNSVLRSSSLISVAMCREVGDMYFSRLQVSSMRALVAEVITKGMKYAPCLHFFAFLPADKHSSIIISLSRVCGTGPKMVE